MNQEELKNLYSNNLKLIKKKLNFTTTELAEKLDMLPRTIGSYERKENLCSAQLITELCQKLNINANWFCTGQGKMFIENKPSYSDVELEAKVVEYMKKYGVIEK